MKKLCCFLLFALVFLLSSCSDEIPAGTQPDVNLVTLPQTNVLLYQGQTHTIVATVSPLDAVDAELEWTSSRMSVCTVEDGFITALQPGISMVTAKAKNGVSASARVEVMELGGITSAAFDQTQIDLSVGEERKMNVTVFPMSISVVNIVDWSSSNENIATVDDHGNVKAVGFGSCFIYANIADKARAVCEVRVGAYEADLSLLVDVTVRDLPQIFLVRDLDGEILTSVNLTSYEVSRTLTTDGVTIIVHMKGTKIFDRGGNDASNPLMVEMDLYTEDDEHLDKWTLTAASPAVGEEVEFEFAFNAMLKPVKRQFYIVLSEVGEE